MKKEDEIKNKESGDDSKGFEFTVEKNNRNYDVDIDGKGKVKVTSEGEGAGGSSSEPNTSTMNVELKVDERNYVCRNNEFYFSSGGNNNETVNYKNYLVFHTEESDTSLLPDSPLDHLRIFKDINQDLVSIYSDYVDVDQHSDQYFDNIEDYKNDDTSCVAKGTLITLADGSKIAVEDLKGDEKVLVWNMYSGKLVCKRKSKWR